MKNLTVAQRKSSPLRNRKCGFVPKVLQKCMILLYDDPSGRDCVRYLEGKYKSQQSIDAYFDEAERLVYKDVDQGLADLIARRTDANLLRIEERVKSLLSRSEKVRQKARVELRKGWKDETTN